MTITKADIIELRRHLTYAKLYAQPDSLYESHDADLYRAMLTALPALLEAAEEREALREKLWQTANFITNIAYMSHFVIGNCLGQKCRESTCEACNGEDAARAAALEEWQRITVSHAREFMTSVLPDAPLPEMKS